ncbi:MAG: glutamine--fructose-6-phosphate transaminase (isomerizing), partial [Nocardioides sp.]|nr:glutamine--fructose-6-phosphate transaminase (isomerizing) [Nocardioides sp.]
MCGIVAYIGGQQAAGLLTEGLARLEHRGYDSAGIAVLGARLQVVKRAGRVRDLVDALPKRFVGKAGIGHTRWATHGPASDVNAHPHTDADGKVAVVHNGIVDNAATLRTRLTDAGVELASDTDTEVFAHLVGRSDADTLEGKVVDALSQVEGTYGLAVVHADFPDRIVVARNGSPLIVGVGEKEMYVASDLAALVRHTTTVAHLDDGELATITADGFRTFRHDLTATSTIAREVDVDPSAYEHGELAGEPRMYTEMLEQPASVERALRGRLDERFGTAHLGGLNLDPRELRAVRRVKILGCGSAYYVGQMGAALIEELARIPADAEAASEFRYRNPIIEPDTLYLAVSQSGETIDTLLAVEEIKRKGGRVLGVVNVVGSAVARAVDGGIYLHAGPEIAVASTKALTNMYVAFALLALQLGRVRDLSIADGRRLIAGLQRLPAQIEEIVKDEDHLASVAATVAEAESMFFVGRVRGYPVAREGAQKLKEISYRHAEAYQTSELKHGPLALISPEVPTVAIVPQDELAERNVAALHEIAARRGPLVVVTHPDVDLGELDALRVDVPK